MSKKSKVFLSHTFGDRNPVKDKLISDLQRLDYIELWRAEEQMLSGKSMSETISQAINNSDYFLLLLSERQGTWQFRELEIARVSEFAQQNSKIIIATTGRNSEDNREWHNLLSHNILQGIKFINFAENYEMAFSYLSQFIKVNKTDSIIQFQLDEFTNKKPLLLITDEVNEKLINYFSSHPNELKTINRRLFEEIVAELFWGFGYQVELTQKTRDGGRDIIAIKNAETIDKYLIECKRPDVGNIIGIKPVRELFGVKQDEKATKAILATTSYFSKDAHQFFERNKWELEPKDFDGIMNWINQYKKIKNIT